MVRRKAFTLIELIVVIIITGILAMISTDIILNIYRSYLQSRSINTLEAQTELVLEQISKRLMFRIKESTIGRSTIANPVFLSTQDPRLNNNYTILEWISYSYESFQNGGWSGLADLQHANTARALGAVETPGSTLNNANADITALTGGRVTLNNGRVGIFFRGLSANVLTSFGYNAINTAASVGRATIRGASNTTLNVAGYNTPEISEYYYLLHTAYAIVPQNIPGSNDFNLNLHYNYQPWMPNGANRYNHAATNVSLLATNVTRFNFTETNGVIVLKICIRDGGRSLGDGNQETTVCKSKAIY